MVDAPASPSTPTRAVGEPRRPGPAPGERAVVVDGGRGPLPHGPEHLVAPLGHPGGQAAEQDDERAVQQAVDVVVPAGVEVVAGHVLVERAPRGTSPPGPARGDAGPRRSGRSRGSRRGRGLAVRGPWSASRPPPPGPGRRRGTAGCRGGSRRARPRTARPARTSTAAAARRDASSTSASTGFELGARTARRSASAAAPMTGAMKSAVMTPSVSPPSHRCCSSDGSHQVGPCSPARLTTAASAWATEQPAIWSPWRASDRSSRTSTKRGAPSAMAAYRQSGVRAVTLSASSA